MENLPNVTLIVLNWNGRSYLDTCLSALTQLDYPQFDIILADNASTDDSVDFVTRTFPQVHIVQNHRNLGYARGNNVMLRDLRSEFAVLVNPDIVVKPDWLRELIGAMITDRNIGIAGCKLYYPGEKLLQHAGGHITQPRAMPDHRGERELDTGQFDVLTDVDYVTGAAFALRSPLIEKIGLFDEGFFMYFEEADYCARARAAGFRVVYVPAATAVHDESATAVRGSRAYLERFHTGRWRYLLKHFDVETILSATFAAEEDWLITLQGDERIAARRAYRTILAGLSSIFNARMNNGRTEIEPNQNSLIASGMQKLHRLALAYPQNEKNLDELAARAALREKPFTSSTPVLGPLLAKIRALWADVAVKEYAGHLFKQQSAFNGELVQRLREIENNLPLPREKWQQKDENLGTIKQQQAEIDAQLARAYQLLASIQSRMLRLEEKIEREASSSDTHAND
ncbi:MAG: glycosyltransferase family 2 protein [Candidatus Promineifilaceae bacterium]|nr:glycosyltransferase family 2 protein [Candidatus Promineifilaceae bacterium]